MPKYQAVCDDCGWRAAELDRGKASAEVRYMGHRDREHPRKGRVEVVEERGNASHGD